MTELTLSDGHSIPLKPGEAKKFRGTRLPGGELYQAEAGGYSIFFHEYGVPLFRFSLRSIHSFNTHFITVREPSRYLRLETVITGELAIREQDGSEVTLLAGQYRISGSNIYQLKFEPASGCLYFVVFISPQLISQISLGETILPSAPRLMPEPMRQVVMRMLDNPFEPKFREGFYDYSVRELLFYHISAPSFTLPGEMSKAEMAAVYAVDSIIAANLNMHYSIHELARMVGTNVFVLKTGFARIFGMGVFERLLYRKMEKAKFLLETTDKQIQEVAELSGYETVTGFINSFRKQFNMTPKDWRNKSRGLL